MHHRTRMMWLVALGACAPTPDTLTDHTAGDGHRVQLPPITFEGSWNDFVTLEAGLDQDCRFLEPLVDDWSTAWPPLQSFWVIYDDPKDAIDGDQIVDVFFLGDQVTADDYPDRSGRPALGFKFPPPVQQSFVRIEDTEVTEEGHLLRATFGSPIDARMAVAAEPTKDGCTLEATHCEQPCSTPEAELSRIDVSLGAFYVPQDVTFYP